MPLFIPLRIVQAYQPPLSTLNDRKQTIAHVEHIIKTTYGPDYSIIDRSLYTYARDVQIAPLELAVHVSLLLHDLHDIRALLRHGLIGWVTTHWFSSRYRRPTLT